MIDIGKKLYAFSGVSVEVIDSTIGKAGAVASTSVSEHRPAGIYNGPKISAVATIFDLLFKYPGTIAVAKCDELKTTYVEITGEQFAITKNCIKSCGTPIKEQYKMVPYAIHEMIFGDNVELADVFAYILDNRKISGTTDVNKVFKFCDSFYYGNVKDASIDEVLFTKAEADAMFRANAWTTENFGFPEFFGTVTAVEPKKKKTAKKTKNADFIKECKDGKYRIPYTWAEEIKERIVNVNFLDSFESTPDFEEIVKKVKYRADKILERMDMGLTGAEAIGKDAMNILLLGKPGTGKTTLAYALSAACGIPICTTPHNKHTDEDEYEGKTKIVDSKPTYVQTDSLLMHTFGGIDVCEEINLADPSVTMGGLGQKLEFPYIVKANGYKTVIRHPLNIVIGTLNVGTNGSNPLNQALANRFKTAFMLDDPTEETFVNILIKSSKKSREACQWVYDAYKQTVTFLKSPEVNEEEICQNLSIRTCLGALDNMEEGQSSIRALVNSIVGAIAVVDLEVARKVERETIDLLPAFSGEL